MKILIAEFRVQILMATRSLPHKSEDSPWEIRLLPRGLGTGSEDDADLGTSAERDSEKLI